MAEDRNDLDRVVDEALSRWSRVEPEPGLEGRVLARLRQEASRGGGRLGAPAFLGRPAARRAAALAATALAAAALLVLAATLALRLRVAPPAPARPSASVVAVPARATTRAPEPPPPSVAVAAVSPGPAAPGTASTGRPLGPSRLRRPARTPRHDVFPVPSPPGEQARLLVAYVERTPLEEVLANKGLLDPPAETGTGSGADEQESRPANGGAVARPVI